MNTFGKRIKEYRIERNLTQKELAKELSVSISTLSHWECDYQEPSFDDLLLLANYFNVTTDCLLGRTDDFGNVTVAKNPTSDLTSEEKHLLETFRKLNMKNRIHVTAYADVRLEEQGTSSNRA